MQHLPRTRYSTPSRDHHVDAATTTSGSGNVPRCDAIRSPSFTQAITITSLHPSRIPLMTSPPVTRPPTTSRSHHCTHLTRPSLQTHWTTPPSTHTRRHTTAETGSPESLSEETCMARARQCEVGVPDHPQRHEPCSWRPRAGHGRSGATV